SVAQRPVSGRAPPHQSIDDVTQTAHRDFHPSRAAAAAAMNCFWGNRSSWWRGAVQGAAVRVTVARCLAP
ncbi:MAG: hypothetical protein M3460_30910, partial [Actinomycetota bacterium]|nr:hypothetical protein [Actinomycetota bacterium]